MHRKKIFWSRHRAKHLDQESRRSSLPSELSKSSGNDRSSILSMCPLAIGSASNLCSYEKFASLNQNERHSQEQLSSRCTSVQTLSDCQSVTSRSSNFRKSRLAGLYRDRLKQKFNAFGITTLLNFHSGFQSCIDLRRNSCLNQMPIHPKLSEESTTTDTVEPSAPRCLHLSAEEKTHYVQRQAELDHTIAVLTEKLVTKTKENVQDILRYWSYLQQLSLDEYQPKNKQHHLFNYLLKGFYFNKNFESYLYNSDEIQAALQVLSSTLTIVQTNYSFAAIERLFNLEQKSIRENLDHRLECLLVSYSEQLKLIQECIRFYQSCPNDEKNFSWIQTIEKDYPDLIGMIADDFITKIPQVNVVLVQMLRDMKKRLLDKAVEL